MAAEDIENKVRKMSSQKPEDGKDLQQLQEAQNQIVQINAERQGNLQTARLENNADAAIFQSLHMSWLFVTGQNI